MARMKSRSAPGNGHGSPDELGMVGLDARAVNPSRGAVGGGGCGRWEPERWGCRVCSILSRAGSGWRGGVCGDTLLAMGKRGSRAARRPRSEHLPRAARFVAYTDGGCHPNPGRGGWGVVLLEHGRVVREASGGEEDSTNNRMELTAAAHALRLLPEGEQGEIHTDSTYVRNGITKWILDWRRRGWRTSEGADVKNQDLWRQLDELLQGRDVQWHWVRGHAGNEHNERADALARAAIRGGHQRAVAVRSAALSSHVDLFCAVAHTAKTQRGSWGVVLRFGAAQKVLTGVEPDTTANRLGLVAVLAGLRALVRPVPVRVFCACDYVVDGATKWLAGWRARSWRTREGKDVANRDLWQELATTSETLAAAEGCSVEWVATGGAAPPEPMQAAKDAAARALREGVAD